MIKSKPTLLRFYNEVKSLHPDISKEVEDKVEFWLLDKYYTKTSTVSLCLQSIDLSDYDLVIEPSAGSGQFLKQISSKRVVAVDLSPESPDIKKQDFLTCDKRYFDIKKEDKVICIGNPPYGKYSQLAIDFFNHASDFCDTIAFVLPKTFRKRSVVNRLNLNFHMVKEVELPLDSFYTKEDESYGVPTVWQIWERKNKKRTKNLGKLEHDDFSFVNNTEEADFMIQRVGVNAGKAHQNFKRSKSSHYLIKSKTTSVYEVFQKANWDKTSKYDTAGNPSITKQDVIEQYERYNISHE